MDDIMQSVYDDMPEPQHFQKKTSEDQKAALEFQRLCYEIFIMHPDGRKLYEKLRENFLINSRMTMGPQAEIHAVYLEGMREVVRGVMEQAVQHKMRIAQQTGG